MGMIAPHLTGAYSLPGADAMERDIDRKLAKMRKRYVASKRHTIQVDYDDYMRELSRELADGVKRGGWRAVGAQAHETEEQAA